MMEEDIYVNILGMGFFIYLYSIEEKLLIYFFPTSINNSTILLSSFLSSKFMDNPIVKIHFKSYSKAIDESNSFKISYLNFKIISTSFNTNSI
jgi:hypothetical protein